MNNPQPTPSPMEDSRELSLPNQITRVIDNLVESRIYEALLNLQGHTDRAGEYASVAQEELSILEDLLAQLQQLESEE